MSMAFTKGPIEGVIVRPLQRFVDERGWLAEIFRSDEVPSEFRPVMGYISMTLPGVLRGPHEHREQADLFCFLGPGDFKLTLWDNRADSPSRGCRVELFLGAANPCSVVIPKGVVHCYRCISQEPGWVTNVPNRLFRGRGKKQVIDEIRHEDDPANPFVVDERERRAKLS
jgi:dTDP-4-dehydrorhamnose 3,5-epimerase